MIDSLFFGRTDQGVVFYRTGRRSCPRPVDAEQATKLRGATTIAVVLTCLLLMGGIAFCLALTAMMAVAREPLGAALGFDPRLLYLVEVPQAGLIAVVLIIYDLEVGRILRA